MGAYILRRLLFMVPTLFGIMTINFLIIQAAPGGPVERTIAVIQGFGTDATERVSGSGMGENLDAVQSNELNSKYRGAQGLDPELIAELERMYGFDKPMHERYLQMIGQYLRFDFGESFYRDQRVVEGAKAVRDGSRFDVWTSGLVIVGYAIPSFLFAILLIVVFAGGHYLDWFPLRGLTSSNWDQLSIFGKIVDYFWHQALPVTAMLIGGFAGLTLLTKNSFLDEINKLYVTTARAKGLSEKRVLYGHVFRNAMLIVIAGFPGAFVDIFFTGALLTEIIFSLDGLGLLGYEAAIGRDYPVMFATLYFFTLLGLLMQLIGDLTYTLVDRRIDFESREV